ncbi:oligosaccharide flippase family protein [Sedimentibacter sp. zth1]|uniref:oligosaccharide flippase family protein n=1 Tax=Sedimentibacter sp. zth1 TaxID=2816908 RepID=UPI001A933789|nr:oligosaccharide flippase family protein [Sedimentibacter sp. zth1]QSX05286.1 oligosaccharide flippase family protein [Sedimentibacter sp. zth1]
MKVNQLKAGAALSYISMGLGYLVSIIYTPIMLRLLGQSEYGLYNLVASVVAYLGVLNFGFGSAYMRYYSRYKAQEEREKIATLNGMFLIIFSVIGFVAVIAGTILALNTELIFGSELTSFELSRAKILMMILVINLAISFPNIVFTSHITANEKFVFQKIVQMIKAVINPFVILPVLIMGYGSVGMVVVTTILNIFIEIINLTYCIRKLKMRFSFRNFDFKLMREMTVFSSFIFINLLIDQINWNVDKFILGRFHGTVTVAVYGLAAQLNTYYLSIASTISSVFIPRVHRLVASSDDNDDLTKLFTRIGRVQFIILSLISTGLVFFGRPFINMWAGNNYDGSYTIVLLLIIPVTIPLIQNIGIEIQRAKNMHQFRSWVYFFIALANLGITIPLAKMYGGVGAAIGTAASLIIGNGLIMNWYNHVKVGLDMKYFWKQILSFIPALIAPIMSGILINKIFNLYSLFYFLGFGIIYVVIFFISMWFFGMNQYEKDLIGKPIKRVVIRICK